MPSRRPSIRRRLTLSLALIAAFVFGVSAAALYLTLENELAADDRAELAGKVKVVQHFIDEAAASRDPSALEHHVRDALIGHGLLHVWLLSKEGDVVLGSTTLPSVVGRSPGHLSVLGRDGIPMDGVQVDARDAGVFGIASMIVALDVRPRQKLLAAFRRTLLLVSALGVMLSVALAVWAARRGLRPVHRLSLDAAGISASSLSRRLSTNVDAELAELVRAFNEVLDRVESAYRQMEAFNADVAHELRTPLATLINAAQVTLSAPRSAAALRDTLAEQLEDLEQIKGIVNDMLFLARADEGMQPVDAADVSLATQARHTIEFYEATLAEAGVEARVHGDAIAHCSAALVQRALANLLSNAIRHTGRGGIIEVTLAVAASHASVEVTNPGPPLDPDVRARMFDRFFRGEASRARTDGSGLGLAIVRAVATMHRGEVFARQVEGGRTAVGFTVPLARRKAAAAATATGVRAST